MNILIANPNSSLNSHTMHSFTVTTITTPKMEHLFFHDNVDFSILETGENGPENGVVVNSD